jgi:hypothetical protein
MTPLQKAVRSAETNPGLGQEKCLDTISLLLEKGANVHIGFEETPLYKACRDRNLSQVVNLVGVITYGYLGPPICMASRSNAIAVVRLLLEKGGQVDRDGGRALGLAVLEACGPYYRTKNKEAARMLFRAGATVGEEFPAILNHESFVIPKHEMLEKMVDLGMNKASALLLLRAYPHH